MSTDFTTGENKRINEECTYLMLSDKLGKLFLNKNINLDRNYFYDKFKEEQLFTGTLNNEESRWALFTRYKGSNDYTNNKFDDVIILNMIQDNKQFLNVKDDSLEKRKKLLNSCCSSYIKDGYCSDFSEKITGFFPHLDRPGDIISIISTSGSIPCIEFGYATLYANITYEDSCGMNHAQPVPTYKDFSFNVETDTIENEKWNYNTLNDISPNYATYNWKVIENSIDIKIKDNITNQKTIQIATLSSASNNEIKISLEYSENNVI
jgi:hypothetical protein